MNLNKYHSSGRLYTARELYERRVALCRSIYISKRKARATKASLRALSAKGLLR